jgi:hypothetical protein
MFEWRFKTLYILSLAAKSWRHYLSSDTFILGASEAKSRGFLVASYSKFFACCYPRHFLCCRTEGSGKVEVLQRI